MIAKKTQLLTIAASFLIPLGAQANDISPEFEFQLANPAQNDITIDGDLSEWAGFELIENPVYRFPKGSGDTGNPQTYTNFNGNEWDGPDDHSITIQTLYDEDYFYVGIVVTDDYHEHAATGPGGAWNGDSVQIHIANDDRDAQVSLINFALEGSEVDDNFFPVCGPAVGDCTIHFESGVVEGDADVAIIRDNVSDIPTTTYEIMLSKDAVGVPTGLVPNISFGMGVDVNDGDFDSPGQTGWSGLGPHSVVHGKSPDETAAFFLGEEVVTVVPGDANGDGKVDAMDLNVLGGNWQMAVAGGIGDGDFNEDGTVNAQDLNILGGNWQFGVGAAPLNAVVPEPSGLQLVILGCFITLVIRRRRK